MALAGHPGFASLCPQLALSYSVSGHILARLVDRHVSQSPAASCLPHLWFTATSLLKHWLLQDTNIQKSFGLLIANRLHSCSNFSLSFLTRNAWAWEIAQSKQFLPFENEELSLTSRFFVKSWVWCCIGHLSTGEVETERSLAQPSLNGEPPRTQERCCLKKQSRWLLSYDNQGWPLAHTLIHTEAHKHAPTHMLKDTYTYIYRFTPLNAHIYTYTLIHADIQHSHTCIYRLTYSSNT